MISTTANPNSDKPLIITLYSSVGSGHRSAAQATAEAFDALRGEHPLVPEDCDIEALDILDFGRTVFDGEKTSTIFTGPARYVYDLTWHYVFTGRFLWGGGSGWSYIMYKPFTEYVMKRKPIAIVATHIVAANAAVAAKMISKQAFPIVSVPTDYGVEGLWPHRYSDLFCVADELMKEELIPRKVKPENIVVTGIPVKPTFSQTYDRATVLKKYGLPEDKMIVLVVAGAKSSQPYQMFRDILNEVLDQFTQFKDMHFVFMTGNDTEYAEDLRAKCYENSLENVTVLDYVENVAELMNASDLAVAKSGGLTVTECLCAELPLVIVGRSFGQERANTITVKRAGAAARAFTAPQLIEELKILHDNPSLLEKMVEGGAKLRRPNSAHDVAIATLDRVGHVPALPNLFLHVYFGKKPLRTR